MKFSLFTFLIFCLCSCTTAPSDKRVFEFEEFKWTITIPQGLKSKSDEVWKDRQQDGMKILEQTVGEELVDQTHPIFMYQKGVNTFDSNWQSYDSSEISSYVEDHKYVNQLLFETFEDQMPKASLDSTYSQQRVGDLVFHRNDIFIEMPQDLNLYTVGFSRLFGTRELTVNMVYIDEHIGEQMIDAFLESSFEIK